MLHQLYLHAQELYEMQSRHTSSITHQFLAAGLRCRQYSREAAVSARTAFAAAVKGIQLIGITLCQRLLHQQVALHYLRQIET